MSKYDTLLKYEMVSFQLSNSNPLISTTPFTISQKWEPHCVVLVCTIIMTIELWMHYHHVV